MRPADAKALTALMPRRARYLVGVSGGADSVALLHLLVSAGYQNLVVCHLNHSLRGRESGADAAFVRRLATSLDLPALIEKIDVAAIAKSSSQSIETAARDARHRLFETAAKGHRCRRVVLAHHGDDQAETVMMAVLRGAGLNGLSGMSPSKEMGKLMLLRPLLAIGWGKSEVEGYCELHQIQHREDASNHDPVYTRNRVRHHLLPAASKAMARDVTAALLRLSETAARDGAVLDSLSSAALAEALNSDHSLQISALQKLPDGLLYRVILAWLQVTGCSNISADLVASVAAISDPTANAAKVNLPGGAWVRRKSGRLFVDR